MKKTIFIGVLLFTLLIVVLYFLNRTKPIKENEQVQTEFTKEPKSEDNWVQCNSTFISRMVFCFFNDEKK